MNHIFIISVSTAAVPTPGDFKTIGTADSMASALQIVATHAVNTSSVSQHVKIEATGTLRALTIKLQEPSQVQENPLDAITYK